MTKSKKRAYTCLDDESLLKLKKLWNLRHPDVAILSNDPKEIWMQMKNRLSSVCNKESCWLKQNFVKGALNRELSQLYAPLSPKEWIKKPNTWLSSVDITSVMKQYEMKYPCFDFIGPSPIDFDKRVSDGECVWNELCNFDLGKQIAKRKTKIGFIFNTDPHYKDGSHWISLFINVPKRFIFFYDSVGTAPPKEVKVFADRVIEQGHRLKNPIELHYDQNHPTEHQYGGTECGVYSLFFIIHMLEDKITGEYLKKHKLSDDFIEKYRKIYFNEEL
jgi:hypothetical protein